MYELFDRSRSRYASGGVVTTMPGELIDSIWLIIDLDLKGVIPLNNLLVFRLQDNHGKVTIYFQQENSSVEIAIDLPYQYSESLPKTVYAYDDSNKQTILLPNEVK